MNLHGRGKHGRGKVGGASGYPGPQPGPRAVARSRDKMGRGEPTLPDDPRDLATLLGAYRVALLITRGADGHLRCRPMAMRQKVRDEEIWFAT